MMFRLFWALVVDGVDAPFFSFLMLALEAHILPRLKYKVIGTSVGLSKRRGCSRHTAWQV